jgi:hypothetical protein
VSPLKAMSAGPSPTAMCAETVFVSGSIRTTSRVWSPATQTEPVPTQTLYGALVPTSIRAGKELVPGS